MRTDMDDEVFKHLHDVHRLSKEICGHLRDKETDIADEVEKPLMNELQMSVRFLRNSCARGQSNQLLFYQFHHHDGSRRKKADETDQSPWSCADDLLQLCELAARGKGKYIAYALSLLSFYI